MSASTPDLRDPAVAARGHFREFSQCLSDLEVAMRGALKAFAAYHATDAKVTREQWAQWFDGSVPDDQYIEGFNAGVGSVLLSVETFLDEHRL